MRKYEDVDVIAALGAVMEINTEHYKSDFQYDLKMFREAALGPDGENDRLLWLSRQSDTECFTEREAYLIESHAHNAWGYYADIPTGVRAYAVTVKGMEGGRVVGDIYELDYRAHTRELKRNAQHVATVSLTFEDGTEAQMPYGEYESRRRGLIHRHGVITEFRREPKDEGALQAALSAARERRERDSRPAAFKAGIQHGKKPSVRQQLSESRRQLDKKRAAAPQKARARPHERAV